MKMNLSIGTKIQYICAAGTLVGTITDIRIAPTAKKGFLNTWLTLDLPVQKGISRAHKTSITADDSSLKMFQVTVLA
jgi:hypothetical protein